MSSPQAPTADEWTHVSRGRGKGRSAQPPPVLNSFPAISKDLDVAEIRKDYNRKLKTWRSSTCRSTLLQILKTLQPDAGWHVHNAVCLAMGSLSRDNLECRRRSMWQMVVFADIIDLLANDEEVQSIEAVLQDPAFTGLDQEFLRTIEMDILPLLPDTSVKPGLGPASAYCGPSTFVLELFMDMETPSIKELVKADVEIYIGSSMQTRIERAKARNARGSKATPRPSAIDSAAKARLDDIDEQDRLALEFDKRYRMYRFPTFAEDPNAFEGLCVFAKEREEDT